MEISNQPNLQELDCRYNYELTTLIITNNPQLRKIESYGNERGNLASITLDGNPRLTEINFMNNQLTNTNFLTNFLNPKKLFRLNISCNNIQPTDIEIFSKFINIEDLTIGGMNKFYGSFESWKNLTKLNSICIETTDINEGLEYLPFSLRLMGMYCSPAGTNAKCRVIQDELKPFNYDVGA